MIIKEVSISDAIKSPDNPFPGLRPFEFNESELFFGRDGQVEKLIEKLGATRFLAVVGTSGSGKSSLVRAGLLPALMGGLMSGGGSNWRFLVMRPGNDPIGNLARALNEPEIFGSDEPDNVAIQTAVAETTLRRGSLGLIEVVRQNAMPKTENLLVVVDQFEELFRFAREAKRKTKAESDSYQNDAAAFVKLLLQAYAQADVNIFVVLTMRSDFLGDCAQFWDLPEAINDSQYLIPRLSREQLREVITGPIALAGGEITPRLVTQLLNDIGGDQDQLPVLQHLLMRVWTEKKEKRLRVEVTKEAKKIIVSHAQWHKGEALDLCCYDAVGGMNEALSLHADEAFSNLRDDGSREVAEKLFKCLTEKGEDNREIRRPITLDEICLVVDAPATLVVPVIEVFRRAGRSFLMPPLGTELRPDSLIDISHESLIRGWDRLRQWVDDEAISARVYRRLAETVALYLAGQAALARDPELQLALDWRDKAKPTAAWARRYAPNFDEAMSFLTESSDARDAEIRQKQQQRRKEVRRARQTAVVLGSLLLLSLGAFGAALVYARRATAETARANGLLAENKRTSEAAKNSAVSEEKARQEKVQAEKVSEATKKESEEALKQKGIADTQRREAERQRGLAEKRSKELQILRSVEQIAARADQNINVLSREIEDALKSKDVDVNAVINKAEELYKSYSVRNDPRGQFESLTILGSAYLNKDPEQAVSKSNEALKILEFNSNLYDQRREHDNLTAIFEAYMKMAYLKRGDEREADLRLAQNAAQKAYRVQEGSVGKGPALIGDLNNLAAVADRLNRGSEGFRGEVIEIQEKAVEESNLQLLNYLNNLAQYYKGRLNYDGAEKAFNQVLEIQRKHYRPNDPILIATLNNLVSVYRYNGKNPEADALVKDIQNLQGAAATLQRGSSGPQVTKLQQWLKQLGFFKSALDGNFTESTAEAVKQFQKNQGLVEDGIAGAQTLYLLEHPSGSNATPAITGKVTTEIVAQLFPGAQPDSIKANLPYVLKALEDAKLTDRNMVLMTLGAIRVEAPNFIPRAEGKNRFNTSAGGHPFDLYDKRMGNNGPPDGEKYKGRGYLQLTGRALYKRYDEELGLHNQLLDNPDLAQQPDFAAKILVQAIKQHADEISKALSVGDLSKAWQIFHGPGMPAPTEFMRLFKEGEGKFN